MQSIAIALIREISKLAMFTILWAFPLWLSKDTGNYNYLWFLILSVTFTMAMFTHYEDLERVDKLSDLKQQEQDNGQTI